MYGKYMWENGDVHLCPWEMTRVSFLWSKIDEKMMIHRWISYGMPYLRFKRYAFIWFYLMPEVRGGLRWQVWWQVRRRWQLDMAMWLAFSVAMKSWWQVWWQNVMANMGAAVFWWYRMPLCSDKRKALILPCQFVLENLHHCLCLVELALAPWNCSIGEKNHLLHEFSRSCRLESSFFMLFR